MQILATNVGLEKKRKYFDPLQATEINPVGKILEQVADLVMITDRNGTIEYVNPAFERITGHSKYEAYGKKSNLLKSGKHSPEFYRSLWNTVLSGKPFQGEIINCRKDGSLFYVEKTITPIRNEEGEITHFVSTDKDVTERKLIEIKTKEYIKKFQDLFNYSHDAMAYCALDGTILEVNDAFVRLTGYSFDELVGKRKYQDMTTEGYWELGNQFLAKILTEDKPITYEKDYIKKNGEKVPVILTAFPVKTNGGDTITAIGTLAIDITERKQHELQLLELNRELKSTNRELERFGAVAAHDLQAPLRTITCYLQLLQQKKTLDAESKKYVRVVTNCSKKLYALIEDLLAYSRVGMKITKFQKVDCKKILEELIQFYGATITEAGAVVTYSTLPEVEGDPTQLSMLFSNIISNALKYRSERVPHIHIECSTQKSDWIFSIKDNGIGIDSKNLEKIFVIFQRLHDDSKCSGTGIGLAIARKVVEAHHGKIWAESKKGIGTTFFFTIPKERAIGTFPPQETKEKKTSLH